jgi:uncharacterized membrane protein YeiH
MTYYLDLAGCAIFAISAILLATKKELDVLGIIVIAFITAVGGGTIRDLLLNTDVFWIGDPTYIHVIIISSLSTYFLVHFKDNLIKFLLYADAFGLTFFAVLGTKKALSLGLGPSVSILMGVLSGVAGGIVRDVLYNDRPIVLRREIYVTAAILCSVSYILLDGILSNDSLRVFVSVLIGLSLRIYAILTRAHLPLFFNKKK